MASVVAGPMDAFRSAQKLQAKEAETAIPREVGDGESSPPSVLSASPLTGSAPQAEPGHKSESRRVSEWQSNGHTDGSASLSERASFQEEPKPENWKSRPELEKLTLRYLGFESSPPAYIAPAQALVMKESLTKGAAASSGSALRSAADMEVRSARLVFRAQADSAVPQPCSLPCAGRRRYGD